VAAADAEPATAGATKPGKHRRAGDAQPALSAATAGARP
jgi:hypothetical protein